MIERGRGTRRDRTERRSWRRDRKFSEPQFARHCPLQYEAKEQDIRYGKFLKRRQSASTDAEFNLWNRGDEFLDQIISRDTYWDLWDKSEYEWPYGNFAGYAGYAGYAGFSDYSDYRSPSGPFDDEGRCCCYCCRTRDGYSVQDYLNDYPVTPQSATVWQMIKGTRSAAEYVRWRGRY